LEKVADLRDLLFSYREITNAAKTPLFWYALGCRIVFKVAGTCLAF